MACAGARVPLLGIAGRFITTVSCGCGTPAGTEEVETPGAVCAPSVFKSARVSVVTHWSRTCIQSSLYLNIEGSLGSSSSFITAFALK